MTSGLRGRAGRQELGGEGEGGGPGGRGGHGVSEDDPGWENGDALGSVVVDNCIVIRNSKTRLAELCQSLAPA